MTVIIHGAMLDSSHGDFCLNFTQLIHLPGTGK